MKKTQTLGLNQKQTASHYQINSLRSPTNSTTQSLSSKFQTSNTTSHRDQVKNSGYQSTNSSVLFPSSQLSHSSTLNINNGNKGGTSENMQINPFQGNQNQNLLSDRKSIMNSTKPVAKKSIAKQSSQTYTIPNSTFTSSTQQQNMTQSKNVTPTLTQKVSVNIIEPTSNNTPHHYLSNQTSKVSAQNSTLDLKLNDIKKIGTQLLGAPQKLASSIKQMPHSKSPYNSKRTSKIIGTTTVNLTQMQGGNSITANQSSCSQKQGNSSAQRASSSSNRMMLQSQLQASKFDNTNTSVAFQAITEQTQSQNDKSLTMRPKKKVGLQKIKEKGTRNEVQTRGGTVTNTNFGSSNFGDNPRTHKRTTILYREEFAKEDLSIIQNNNDQPSINDQDSSRNDQEFDTSQQLQTDLIKIANIDDEFFLSENQDNDQNQSNQHLQSDDLDNIEISQVNNQMQNSQSEIPLDSAQRLNSSSSSKLQSQNKSSQQMKNLNLPQPLQCDDRSSSNSSFLECSILMMNEGANGDEDNIPQTPFSPSQRNTNNPNTLRKKSYHKSKFSQSRINDFKEGSVNFRIPEKFDNQSKFAQDADRKNFHSGGFQSERKVNGKPQKDSIELDYSTKNSRYFKNHNGEMSKNNKSSFEVDQPLQEVNQEYHQSHIHKANTGKISDDNLAYYNAGSQNPKLFDFNQAVEDQEQRQKLLKEMNAVDRQLFHEQSKRMKIDKKLRTLDQENVQIRTMINFLLNAEFALGS
eukprot:403364581